MPRWRGERTARRAAEALAARLEAENAEIAEQVRRLEHLNDELRKLLFGKKSEKLGADERQLSFDDLGTAVSEASGAPAADEQDGEAEPRRRQRRSARPGARFPAHIERRVDVIEPDSTLCPCGCGEMTKIGEDRSERLDIVPARFLVIETVRPRYACNRCKGGGVVQAAAPASLIEGGLPTEGVLAHVLISKYGDHLPLYRQSQIYARLGLDLHRATLADWVGKASFHLRPVVDFLAAELKTSGEARGGRDHGPGSRPGPRQDEDGLYVDDGARRAAVVGRGPAGRCLLLCAGPAAASMARSFSRVFPGRRRSTVIPGTTGCAGRTGRAGR